jgi:hypothetical protein
MTRIETNSPPPAPSSVWFNFVGFLLPLATAVVEFTAIDTYLRGTESAVPANLLIIQFLLLFLVATILAWWAPSPRWRSAARWCCAGFVPLLGLSFGVGGFFMASLTGGLVWAVGRMLVNLWQSDDTGSAAKSDEPAHHYTTPQA